MTLFDFVDHHPWWALVYLCVIVMGLGITVESVARIVSRKKL